MNASGTGRSPIIHIDGSRGEGGGQILRTALSLSLLTGKPFRIDNIRASRPRPGLASQHLASVKAAVLIGKARETGAVLRSRSLTFIPGPVHAGAYSIDIGTAGATGLVLQTVLLPLALGNGPSSMTIRGGTHVPWSPNFHFLDLSLHPILQRIGIPFTLTLEQAGFYPQGRGVLRADIRQTPGITPLLLKKRGKPVSVTGISAVANLPLAIAERQKKQVLKKLRDLHCALDITTASLPGITRGTVVALLAEFEHCRACFTALGARGKPAEEVANEAVRELEVFLGTGAAVEPHLADQLVLPLSLAKKASTYTVSAVTAHLLSNAEITRLFLPLHIDIQGSPGAPGTVRIIPAFP